jgi:hypothetical protein
MGLKHFLIISNICIVISFILFRLLNRDETMFRQRRVFIILSVLLSLLLPLSGLRIQLPKPATEFFPVYATGDNVLIQAEDTGIIFENHKVFILYFYFIVSGIIILNILFQLLRVFWFYLISDIEEGNIIKVNSLRLENPFSFFKWIFIPRRQDSKEDLLSIIIHESIHGKQLHTVDNIILEIACAIIWFNPVIWIMKREIHLLHEYLADEGTLNSGIEKISYQSLLINQAAEEKLIVVPSNFNNNHLKKRIIMMTQNKKEGHNGLMGRKLIPLSVLILAVSILQCFYPVNVKGQNNGKQQQTKQQDKVTEDKSKEVVVTGYGTPDTTDSVKFKIRSVNGKDNVLVYIDDKESTKAALENMDPESIESISVLKGEPMRIYTTKDYDGVLVVRTKKDYTSETKDSKPKAIIVTGYGTRDSMSAERIIIRNANNSDLKNTLFIIDQKEASREEFENIEPDMIKTVTVIKDKDQMGAYTKKDYDGVIVVTTKK